MRKITEDAVNAFMFNHSFDRSNTSVEFGPDQMEMFLHGNLIAIKNHKTLVIEVSLSGWNTRVTRERLNGIPGVSISTSKGQAYLNGNPIDNNKFYTI
jgi:hypothetical protein